MSCQRVQGEEKPLITLEVRPHGNDVPMRALFDTGASNNFVRTEVHTSLNFVEIESPRSMLSVRLATCSTVTIPKRVIRTRFELDELSFEDECIVLDLDDKFDVILGIPWMSKHQPTIDWVNLSIDCGGLTGSDHPVSNPAVSNDTTAESDSLVGSDGSTRSDPTSSADGTPADQSPEGLTHATNESLRVSNVCNKGKKHPRVEVTTTTDDGRGIENLHTVGNTHREKNETVTEANDFRVENKELTTKNSRECMNNMVDSGHHEEKALCTSDDHRATDQTSASDLAAVSVETINVLTQTETGLATQSLTLDNPPNLSSEVMALPALSWKKFVKNLRNDQIDQICVIVTCDEVVDIRSGISTLQLEDIGNELVPNDQTKVQRFEAQSWESLKATSPYYEVL